MRSITPENKLSETRPVFRLPGVRIQCLILALLVSALYFSNYLFTSKPHLKFFGDVAILYFPQFVEGFHMAKSNAMIGIDMLTGNGASGYFLRPNIPVYYPVYQFVYKLLGASASVGTLARAFVIVLFFHGVLSSYYCLRLGRRYFQLGVGPALLLAVLYTGAVAGAALTAPPFYYVATLFPFMLYYSFQSVEKGGWWRIVLHSFPYVLVFLSGYVPLDVNAVALAMIFSVIYFFHAKEVYATDLRVLGIRFFAPVLIASSMVVLLYAAMHSYNQFVTSVPKGVFYSAHHFAFQFQDIFALLTRSVTAGYPEVGAPFVRLGLAPLSILICAFTYRKRLGISVWHSRIIAASITIFSFYLLLSFGQSSGLPDLFYWIVPVLGGMHFYGRYLLIGAFFFFLAVAIAFKYLVAEKESLPIGRWLAGLAGILLVVFILGMALNPAWINLKLLTIELLMLGMFFLALTVRQNFYAFTGVIAISLFVHVAEFNAYTSNFQIGIPGPYSNEVSFSKSRTNGLLAYFQKNSQKTLIKYADITKGIEKKNGLILNFPWMVSEKVKLSNYMGYEPHLSLDKDYMSANPHPYYGYVELPYLLRTGADFIIFDAESWAAYGKAFEGWMDRTVPEYDLGSGYRAAKLKDASGLIDFVPVKNSGDFDNGIVRVSNPQGTARVSNFETNFVSRFVFNVESELPVQFRYLLFPNKFMELRIDGELQTITPKDGLIDIDIPAGKHLVEYSYKNPTHRAFTILYRIYFWILLAILVWRAWLAGSSRFKMKNTQRLHK